MQFAASELTASGFRRIEGYYRYADFGLLNSMGLPELQVFGVSEAVPSRLPPRDACMAIVASSFQLDVTDARRGAALLAAAAKVADHVPAFTLAYPRDFDMLPSVRAAMLEQCECRAGASAFGQSG